MTSIDFSRLPVDRKRFEALACELLRSMGFPILEEPAEGPDGGCDILIERITKDALIERRERVVVQCKHFASSGRSVSEKDLGIWENAVRRFNADGYLLITSTTVTVNLNKVFVEYTRSEHPKFASFWSAEKLELLLNEHPEVRDTFFPPEIPRASRDLGEHGWAIVYPADGVQPEVRNALRPLIELRKSQVESSYGPGIFKVFSGESGVRSGESAMSWLARHGVGPGTPDPRKVPSFLLLVGDPGAITFDFQAHLEVQYYVGRLAFDEVSDYQKYAEAIVEVEKSNLSAPRNVALLAPEVDKITRASNDMLVRELYSDLKDRKPDWNIQHFDGELADKNHMVQIMNGQNETSLVFAATHGVALSSDDENQRLRQGALITNDWNIGGKPEETEIFAAADIMTGTKLLGSMYFLFGCFGAGTTAEDDYLKVLQGRSVVLTRAPFVAALPQRMLAAGAAGIIGHVGRAWGHSFSWEGAGAQPQTFLAVLESLLSGEPIGVAIHALSKRYAELAAAVASLGSDPSRSSETSSQELLNLKTAMLDAKYYIVLGDPVVRLR